MNDPCVFCDIIAGKNKPADYHDYGPVVRFTPRNPVVSGHRLFAPIHHVTNAVAAPELAGLVAVFAVDWGAGMGDFNVIVNNGPHASQTIQHLHWHVVPRREGDGLALPWTGAAKVADELERMAQAIDNAPYPYEVLLERVTELRGGAR